MKSWYELSHQVHGPSPACPFRSRPEGGCEALRASPTWWTLSQEEKGRARHYLEGLKLTLYLLGEVLAVLSQLALLGGLSNGVLKLGFQLQKEEHRFLSHRASARIRQIFTQKELALSHKALKGSVILQQIVSQVKG